MHPPLRSASYPDLIVAQVAVLSQPSRDAKPAQISQFPIMLAGSYFQRSPFLWFQPYR
jgi:hypothetical protein